MSKMYNVPTVDQHAPKANCWHASAEMIWLFWQTWTKKAGPMNTLTKNYIDGGGVADADLELLAATVGLKTVPNTDRNYTAALIEKFLVSCGPLFCIGVWYGPKHAIVLTGINGETIFFNNPEGGIKSTNTAKWFNQRLMKTPGCLMYADPKSYLRAGYKPTLLPQ